MIEASIGNHRLELIEHTVAVAFGSNMAPESTAFFVKKNLSGGIILNTEAFASREPADNVELSDSRTNKISKNMEAN